MKKILKTNSYKLKTVTGFTLVELLVVVSIIFLLTSVFISSAGEARAKAMDAKKQVEIKEVQKAMFAFKSDKGKVPGISGLYKESTSANSEYKIAMNNLVPEKYISKIPESKDQSYYYYQSEDGEATLLTLLATENDQGQDCVSGNDEFECDIDEENKNILKLKKKTDSDWASYDTSNVGDVGEVAGTEPEVESVNISLFSWSNFTYSGIGDQRNLDFELSGGGYQTINATVGNGGLTLVNVNSEPEPGSKAPPAPGFSCSGGEFQAECEYDCPGDGGEPPFYSCYYYTCSYPKQTGASIWFYPETFQSRIGYGTSWGC
jgi:type II secretory pathway pseudopilin PulG